MTLVKKTFVAMLAASAIGSAQAGVLLADSVADFSGAQGANSWYYGVLVGDDFRQFDQFDSESWSDSAASYPSTLWADHGISATRRWVSESTGSVTISGVLATYSHASNPDGISGAVFVNGRNVWEYEQPAVFEMDFSFDTVLNEGDKVDFFLSYLSGDAKFNATITAVPEPETYAMFLAGLGILGAVARRKRVA